MSPIPTRRYKHKKRPGVPFSRTDLWTSMSRKLNGGVPEKQKSPQFCFGIEDFIVERHAIVPREGVYKRTEDACQQICKY
jgi:hypothetical protein